MRHFATKTTCWSMSFVLLTWCVLPGFSIGAEDKGRANTGTNAAKNRLALPSKSDLAKGSKLRLELGLPQPIHPDEASKWTKVASTKIPKARYDLAARAKTLGLGVEGAFVFVRDQIRFEAYPGAFRGARGTYIARAGNALDRSLLLAHLLKHKGVRTRFAACHLAPAEARRLFERIFEKLGKTVKEPLPRGSVPNEIASFQARLSSRALRDYGTILSALGDHRPARVGPSRKKVLKEIEAHAWVQAEVDGRWVDLDSAFAEAVAGRAYCSPKKTFDALPASMRQQVTVRVVVETLVKESLTKKAVLTFAATAENLIDRPIFLIHGGGGGLAGGMAGAIQEAKGGGEAWRPALWVGGQLVVGKPVTFSDQKPAKERKIGPPTGGLRGIFGAGGALGSASEQFVAEWLEFEIALPDGRREVTRRALVDRAGGAQRAAGKIDSRSLRPLARNKEGLVAPQAAHGIWLSGGTQDLWAFAQSAQGLVRMIRETKGQSLPEEFPIHVRLWPLAMQAFSFSILSDLLVVPALNDGPSHRFYADSARILIVSVGPVAKSKTGDTFISYDLRRDHLRGLARTPSGDAGVVQRKLWFGVLEGALEHEVTAENLMASGGDPSSVLSTSALLTNDGALALRPGDAGGIKQLGLGSKTAARLSHALKKGNLLVVPRSVSRGRPLGWWQIDPKTGDTLSVLGGLNPGYGSWDGGSARNYRETLINYVDPETGEGGVIKRKKGGGEEKAGVMKLSTMLTYRTVTVGTLLKWGVAVVAVGVVAWLVIR